jgi:nicotinamidase-related amidase
LSAFPGRVLDRRGRLRRAGEPEVERHVKRADGQHQQHDNVDQLREKALFGRTVSHIPSSEPLGPPHLVEMLQVQAVDEVFVAGVMAQHRDDRRGVEHQQTAAAISRIVRIVPSAIPATA